MKEIINQLYEMEQKGHKNDITMFERHIKRMYHELERMGYTLKDPTGEKFSEERTDIDATVMGALHPKMKISKVLKPIIYKQETGQALIVQKGVVIVE